MLVGGGWAAGVVLAAFFVSSSAVGRLSSGRSGAMLDESGERRNARQVLANGGPALVGALLGGHDPALALWITTGSLAAAAADTWATGLGARSPSPTRRLLVGPRVAPGTSGGMTSLGTAGGFAGALLVAATGAVAARDPGLLPAATLIGFAGMVVDSVLGATVQGRFRCPGCAIASERRVHRCGALTVLAGGLPWLDNDAVNLAATAMAALLAAAWLACSR